MIVAQQLYEGVRPGPRGTGRVDHLYADRFDPDSPRGGQRGAGACPGALRPGIRTGKTAVFKNRKKAQDAHEAIRPTSVYNTPEKLARFLTPDQMALYRLIWNRFVASQMMPALIDQNTVTIGCGDFDFNGQAAPV